MSTNTDRGLPKTLGRFRLSGIAFCLVISGQYFGVDPAF
jgi:hypothetical protein